MGAPDESTDPSRAVASVTGIEPDLRVRPAIEGTDPLAQGGWHSSGGTKATVVETAPPPTFAPPNTLVEAVPTPTARARTHVSSSEIEVVPATGIPAGRVVLMLAVVSAIAFAVGRCTG